MMKEFRRISARGASALSCWRLSATAAELAALLGPAAAAPGPRLVRLGPPGAHFDAGLAAPAPDGALELHLHGGAGVAQALRAWLQEQGWREEPGLEPLAGPVPDFPDAADAARRFLRAESPAAARAWSAFQRRDAPRTLAEGASLSGAARAEWVREQLRHADWAEALESPPALVLAGPPNAGKSSLFNAWLRAARATVADAPGTTRDLVGERLLLGAGADAWSLQLVDTAGLWDAAQSSDRLAVQRTEAALASAWRTLWVFDAAEPPGPRVLAALASARARDLFLLHRADLPSRWDPERLTGRSWLRGSIQRDGEALLARLESGLAESLGPRPAPEAWLPFGPGLRAQLRTWAELAAADG